MRRDYIEAMHRNTERAAKDPQPGDYFTDHFSPVAKVTRRNGEAVYIVKPNYEAGVWHDTEERMWVDDFEKWLSYGNIPGYWCECWPKRGDEPPSGGGTTNG